MRVELVADSRAYKVDAVLVEALPHQQVDLPQIHWTHVDRDLLQLGQCHLSPSYYHLFTICMDGNASARQCHGDEVWVPYRQCCDTGEEISISQLAEGAWEDREVEL